MWMQIIKVKLLSLLLVTVAALVPSVRGEPAPNAFYRAYYLEQVEGDFTGAAKLYESVVADSRMDAAIRTKAKARLRACREEQASTDFASLVPETTIAYVELHQPGEQVKRLLNQLGLLGDDDGLTMGTSQGRRVSISPKLINELLGLRGAALAITGINIAKGEPSGVVIFHPGNMDVIRGLLETGLPIAGKTVKPIGGYPTFDIEGEGLVTLTSRLVVASTSRGQIEAVIRRLSGKERDSLATNPDMVEALRNRDDALIHFCVNARPIMPVINGLLATGAMGNPEMALAQAMLDPNSLQSIVGQIGVTENGVSLDLSLRLADGHRNLAYNLLRMPAVNHETFRSIPKGVAAFLVGAINESTSRYTATTSDPATRYVSVLDIGREIFANITSFSVYVIPPKNDSAATGPMPDMVASFFVNDSSKSEALWSQILGIASLASGSGTMQGNAITVHDVKARRYGLPDGKSLFFAMGEHRVVLATSKTALASGVGSIRSGNSIMDDPAFSDIFANLSDANTAGVFVHPGRMMRVVKPFLSEGEARGMAQFAPLLENTVASAVIEHSHEVLHLSIHVTGIPDVSGMISQLIESEMQQKEMLAGIDRAIKKNDHQSAIRQIDEILSKTPDNCSMLRKKFYILSVKADDRDAAMKCGQQVYACVSNSPNTLNTIAWRLLTQDRYAGKYNELALRMSERSNKLTHERNWMYVDTLAVAKFETGDITTAIQLEKKAIELADGKGAPDLQQSLARFESALEKSQQLATTAD